jgi:hypothetical protein
LASRVFCMNAFMLAKCAEKLAQLGEFTGCQRRDAL